MTEEQIEIRVEKMIDALDRRFTAGGSMTQDEYDAALREIDAWAAAQRRQNRWRS